MTPDEAKFWLDEKRWPLWMQIANHPLAVLLPVLVALLIAWGVS
jgi:hypothetical protein